MKYYLAVDIGASKGRLIRTSGRWQNDSGRNTPVWKWNGKEASIWSGMWISCLRKSLPE